MPAITQAMWEQLGETGDVAAGVRALLKEKAIRFAEGQAVRKGAPLFPRKEAPAA
jgi:hypothetical protein